MAAATPSADDLTPTRHARLTSGEAVVDRARAAQSALESGMLSNELWLRGDIGALRPRERPPEWDGRATWWMPQDDRQAALLSVFADLAPWLPPGLDAARKMPVADRMAFPLRFGWDGGPDSADRPFVDAVFVDDAAHLHLVDALPVGAGDVMRTFADWRRSVQARRLGEHWFNHQSPASPLLAQYHKRCWLHHVDPLAGVCELVASEGDPMPEATAAAFWRAVGRRCSSYHKNEADGLTDAEPHCILLTDGAMPPDARLLELGVDENQTLACVTPFVVGKEKWLRVEVRGWTPSFDVLAESAAPPAEWGWRMAGATDVGKRRTANQDALRWSVEEGWAAVADGMGGHPNGDVASATALRVFEAAMGDWPADASALHPRGSVAQRLRRAAFEANAALWKENEGAELFDRMGTTLCALRLHGDRVSIVHAGDSRIYEFIAGDSYTKAQLRCLTEDHGEGGGLDRALGLWQRVPCDIDTLPLDEPKLYLLCTDGLTNMVDDRQILDLCQRHGNGELGDLVAALIDAANEAGGADNITVCVVEVDDAPD